MQTWSARARQDGDTTIVMGVNDATSGPLSGYLTYEQEPLVSSDIIHDSSSCVFDSGLTQASGSFVKVFGWYDNEWGYTCRLADLTRLIAG